jgi:hypothetical protein
MVRFFERRKAAYQAFVEKRAGQLEKPPAAKLAPPRNIGLPPAGGVASLNSGFHY